MTDRFSTFRFTSALLVLTLSLAACSTATLPAPGSGSGHAATLAAQGIPGQSSTSQPIDTIPTTPLNVTPATVTASTPANGAIGLPSTGFTVSVTFSKAMSTLATQHAFALIVPDFNAAAEHFTWNSARTIMTMQYTSAVPAGTLVFWGMGAGALDLAGKALAHADNVGGSFRVLREKTVKLYSDPEKDLWVTDSDAANFGAYSARVGTEAVGGDEGRAEDGTRINDAGAVVERMLLQFSLNKLPDLASMKQVKKAILHTTMIHTIGGHTAVDTLVLQNVSTVKWFDGAALWGAPEVLPAESKPSMEIGSAPMADVTTFMDYDVKHAAQLFGLSQWRLRMSDEYVPQNVNPNSSGFINAMNNAVEFALGAYPIPSSQPYIEVTYAYP
ncbi:Ig-like domain-containing protein [Deinococcus alpinitundrae]|uniref:Ig-like domain-containing protein n=1 Tax=Deinococcus alpinitundrae TaxID=468913 RepID=UPI001379CED6|nr:Ig-like domain-containing protein [Deinococcus alpinitundrae]